MHPFLRSFLIGPLSHGFSVDDDEELVDSVMEASRGRRKGPPLVAFRPGCRRNSRTLVRGLDPLVDGVRSVVAGGGGLVLGEAEKYPSGVPSAVETDVVCGGIGRLGGVRCCGCDEDVSGEFRVGERPIVCFHFFITANNFLCSRRSRTTPSIMAVFRMTSKNCSRKLCVW